ncbi:RNA/RNP complex-1-interacting phosphatase [Pelodytes ibericus]
MVVLPFRSLLCRFPRVFNPAFIHLTAQAMGKNHLPDRWTEYVPVGKRIPGTRFICFKVPLKKIYENKLAPQERFSLPDLIQEIQKQNEELGLVVDLTCTTRYYWPEELPNTLSYTKLFTAGHEVPSDEVIYQFKCIVRNFLRENSENDKLIGVHCTHGLNRTGYLVCRYLIDVVGMVPADAIEKFNRSRGHCIERKNYIDDLVYGNMRNNSGLNKPRLPLAKYQQHIQQIMNAPPAPISACDSPIRREDLLWPPSCIQIIWTFPEYLYLHIHVHSKMCQHPSTEIVSTANSIAIDDPTPITSAEGNTLKMSSQHKALLPIGLDTDILTGTDRLTTEALQSLNARPHAGSRYSWPKVVIVKSCRYNKSHFERFTPAWSSVQSEPIDPSQTR